MAYELIASSQAEGAFLAGSVGVGALVRETASGRVFMVETAAMVQEYYGGNIWDDDLWRWRGDFPEAPWCSDV